MKQFMKSFLSLSLLVAVAMGVMGDLQANGSGCCGNNNTNNCCNNSCNNNSNCGSCSDSCSTSCSNNSNSNCGSCKNCHSVFIPRSQHSNTAYFFWPENPLIVCPEDEEDWSGGLALGFEYTRSFKGSDIAKCLFGAKTLTFQGSRVTNRSATALIADNFGLSQEFNGTLTFCPRIQNFNLHFQSQLGFGCWCDGLYGQLNFTFTHQKRNLFDGNSNSCCSCDPTVTGTTAAIPFPVGYMADGTTTVPAIATLKEALNGQTLFGDMQDPWKFGRFSFCDRSINKVSGVTLILGYNFWKGECGHFGAFFQYVAPTGNRPHADFVFSPVAGNGHHHELGGGISAHWEMWKADDCDRNITAYLDGFVVTLLKDCQARSFDFKDKGCLSRYMLLKELTSSTATVNSALTPANSFPALTGLIGFNYAGHLINGINFATRNASVRIPVKGDASIRFVYHDCGFDFALGYNIYGQSSERICNVQTGSPCNAVDTTKHYGFKGCTGVATYVYATAAGVTTGTATANPLNATSSASTITTCGAVDNPVALLNTASPGAVGVDWTNAYRTPGVQANAVAAGTNATNGVNQSSESVPALEVTTANLDLNSGKAPRQLTNKGFATLDYTWTDCDWKPYLGVGAEAEGGSRCCDLKQWGVWIRGGVTF